MNDHENASLFERLKKGLEESIAHSRGELTLRTTTLPAPPPPVSSRRVLTLRRKLKMSQAYFAGALNVSPKLVQGWEQGVRRPRGSDLRLIQIIETNPDVIADLIVPIRSGLDKSSRARRAKAAA